MGLQLDGASTVNGIALISRRAPSAVRVPLWHQNPLRNSQGLQAFKPGPPGWLHRSRALLAYLCGVWLVSPRPNATHNGRTMMSLARQQQLKQRRAFLFSTNRYCIVDNAAFSAQAWAWTCTTVTTLEGPLSSKMCVEILGSD